MKKTKKKSLLFTKNPYNTKYLLLHPWEIFLHIGRDIKCAWQRAKYGYCFRDIWSIDWWFISIIPQMIHELNEKQNAHPCTMPFEEWKATLDEMAFYFTEANEDTCTQQNEIDYSFDCQGWLKREKELDQYREECLQKGFNLFVKYFHDLWD